MKRLPSARPVRPVSPPIPEHNLKARTPVPNSVPGSVEPEFRYIPFANYQQRHRSFPYHRHDFHEIVVIEQGEGTHEVDFVEHVVQPRTIFFLHPKQVHLLQKASLQSGHVIIFGTLFLERSREYAPFQPGVSQPFIRPDAEEWETLLQSFSIIRKELLTTHPDHLILRSSLQTFLLLATRIHQRQEPAPTTSAYDRLLFADFRSLLESHLGSKPEMEFYAASLKITERKLNELAKQFTGRTAWQLHADRVMLEAKRLLLFSAEEVKTIAAELGFTDPYYFSRFFKKKEGASPEQYRQSKLKSPSQW